ncbi:MAG TPA: hypothetical protein VG488_08645 [Candidatus Angelobacter sp.]|jgi:deoxycytidine triphosphate deaminase|nr:hypothetical protein [Candidatus Angelobacter sp.]
MTPEEHKPPDPIAEPATPQRTSTIPEVPVLSVPPTEMQMEKPETSRAIEAKPVALAAALPDPPRTDRETELERLSVFREAPFDPNRPIGVLLSDEIDYYAKNYQLIHPYSPHNLKPAGYELRVGEVYAMDGQATELKPSEKLTIPPFSVAVIQTLETLNLPHHLIARWNIRTRWAYKGLLWVGAAQVDAGFRGYLACPLYNLSNQAVEVAYGDQIAVIDFVTTTPPTVASKPYSYSWRRRTRVTFREYQPEKLLSALATDVKDKLKDFEADLKGKEKKLGGDIAAIQARVDTFTSSTFTVIAMLFAALGLAVARTAEPSFWSSTIWLAALSLWFAMRAYVLTKSGLQHWARQTGSSWNHTRVPWKFEVAAGFAIATLLLVAQYRTSAVTGHGFSQLQSQFNTSQEELKNSKAQLEELRVGNSNLAKEVQDLQTAVEKLKKYIPPK